MLIFVIWKLLIFKLNFKKEKKNMKETERGGGNKKTENELKNIRKRGQKTENKLENMKEKE